MLQCFVNIILVYNTSVGRTSTSRDTPLSDGMKVDNVLELAGITSNGYELYGDTDPENEPGGVRFGSCALTTRTLKEDDFRKIARFVHRGVEITVEAKSRYMGDVGFVEFVESDAGLMKSIGVLEREVKEFSGIFPVPANYSDI